jgi:hypothetical protein
MLFTIVNIRLCITAPFFLLPRTNAITMDIDFLAPKLDGHALRLGNGTKEVRKTWVTLAIILGALSFL